MKVSRRNTIQKKYQSNRSNFSYCTCICEFKSDAAYTIKVWKIHLKNTKKKLKTK